MAINRLPWLARFTWLWFGTSPGKSRALPNAIAVARRAFTLAEVMIAMALLAVVSTVAYEILAQLFRFSGRASQRSKMQAEGTVVLSNLASDLRLTRADRISTAPLTDGGLCAAFACARDVTGQGVPIWQNWVSYVWRKDSGKLVRRHTPPGPPNLTVSFNGPGALPGSDLVALSNAGPNGTEHRLSDCVKAFTLVVVEGKSVNLTLDLAVDGRRLEKLNLKTTVALKK